MIEWPSEIDIAIMEDIVSFEKLIAKEQKVLDTIIAYNSLTIVYKKWDNYSRYYKYKNLYDRTVEKLKELYLKEREVKSNNSHKIWEIPVCYDLCFGLDLEELAIQKKLSVEEIIQLHSEATYSIYFIGFQPGFLYLGGLHEKLHTPRRSTPRLRVEKGTLGIGGVQTGVYPQNSAGGWNLIGKSPVQFFEVSKSNPCFAKAGDQIRFVPIDLESYNKIDEEVKKGNYKPKFSKS